MARTSPQQQLRPLTALEQQFVKEAEDGCFAALRDEADGHPYAMGAPRTSNLFSMAVIEIPDPLNGGSIYELALVNDPFTALPRARAMGWRGWAARVLGTKHVRETEHERVEAYSWRGTLYIVRGFPPDANFCHD